jgi:hypothetical protein
MDRLTADRGAARLQGEPRSAQRWGSHRSGLAQPVVGSRWPRPVRVRRPTPFVRVSSWGHVGKPHSTWRSRWWTRSSLAVPRVLDRTGLAWGRGRSSRTPRRIVLACLVLSICDGLLHARQAKRSLTSRRTILQRSLTRSANLAISQSWMLPGGNHLADRQVRVGTARRQLRCRHLGYPDPARPRRHQHTHPT